MGEIRCEITCNARKYPISFTYWLIWPALKRENIMAKKTEVVAEPVITIIVQDPKKWVAKHVKPAALDRESNRQKMLLHVMSFHNKLATEWLADFVANPPAVIKKGSRTAYTPKQWLTWFVKANVISLKTA